MKIKKWQAMGFTLLELLVVMVIIGLLVGYVDQCISSRWGSRK